MTKKIRIFQYLAIAVVVCMLLYISWRYHVRWRYHKFFGQDNAIWTESIFFRGYSPSQYEELTAAHITDYAQVLKDHHVKYAFFFAGPFGDDGHLPSYAFSVLAFNVIQRFKNLYPDLTILPWVGGIQNKTIHLEDSTWRSHAISDCKKLVQNLQVKGLHIDLEHLMPAYADVDTAVVQKGSEDLDRYPYLVNAFHHQLRDSLPNAYISAVVTSTPPQTTHWKRKTSVEELRPLLADIDQLLFLFYDTMIGDTTTFRLAAEQQMIDLQTLKATRDIPMMLAIATFINPEKIQKFHNLEVENIPNALETIKTAALKISPTKRLLDGIGIYGNWETDYEEWQQIKEHYTH